MKTHEQLATEATSRTLETTNGVVGDSDHRGRDRRHLWAVRERRWCRPAVRGEDKEAGVRVPHCICRQLQAASHNLTSVDGPKVTMPFVAMIILWPWYPHKVPTKVPIKKLLKVSTVPEVYGQIWQIVSWCHRRKESCAAAPTRRLSGSDGSPILDPSGAVGRSLLVQSFLQKTKARVTHSFPNTFTCARY